MAHSTLPALVAPPCKKRRVEVSFTGGTVSSDGGMLLLRAADKRLKLLSRIARLLTDPREPGRCVHDVLSMLRQRVYGIAAGYEDLNDHTTLREDPGFQTAVERDTALASMATLCRFENRANREMVRKIQREEVEQFIRSYERAPKEVVLDFDGTDSEVHGHQERRHYHGHYGHYCFLPLHVYCGERVVVSYLRPANRGGGRHAWGVLAMLVRRLREAWPGVRIVFRGDCGFNRHQMMGWCERQGVGYVIGQAKNPRLMKLAAEVVAEANARYEETKKPQRLFGEVRYAADTWKRERRVVVKAEYNEKGPNTRFLVTTLAGTPEEVYDEEYCPRGEMENRIKELQLDLFADRMSCHRWYANEFRLLLSGLAYILIEAIRRLGLSGTELARAQSGTIRLTLIKIGAVITRSTRRVRFMLSSAYPHQDLFLQVMARLQEV